jgi:hypothetical protein
MISLVTNLVLTYFTLKFFLWLYDFSKDEPKQETSLINDFKEKIEPKPLNLPPDTKITLLRKNINRIKDTNFKNLLAKQKKIKKHHLSISVNY